MIKRIVRGLLNIDSYLHETIYDLILITCRDLTGCNYESLLRIVFLVMSFRITRGEKLISAKIIYPLFKSDDDVYHKIYFVRTY